MKKRTITLVIQPSGNIRSIRNNDPKKGSASEMHFIYRGGVMETINTAHVPKIVTYYWDEETNE